MRRMSGFSLMEMMVVLLIVAIVAAASAPMVSKKFSGANTAAGVGCLWRTHEDTDKFSVTYNSVAKGNKSVVIGAKNTDLKSDSPEKPRLHIKTSSEKNPHIRFEYGTDIFNLQTKKDAIWFSNKALTDGSSGFVAIGSDVTASTLSTAIGYVATANGTAAVAIGDHATSASGAVAIGSNPTAFNNSIAIGQKATTYASGAVALGPDATANGARSVAIGKSSSDKTPCGASSDGIGIKGYANGTSSVAIGDSSFASSSSGVALGAGSNAGGSYATALGSESHATSSATAVGYGSVASGSYSVAVGRDAVVSSGSEAIAIGYNAKVYGDNAIAIGAVSADSNEVKLGTDDHKVYLGRCEFEKGVAYIDTLHVKHLLVEDEGKVYFNANKDKVSVPWSGLAISGELSAKSLSVSEGAVFGTTNSDSLVYVKGNFVSDGNSIISRKDGKQAFYKVWGKDSKGDNRDGFNNLMHLNIDGGHSENNEIEGGGRYTGTTSSYSNFNGDWSSKPSDRRLKNVGEVFTAGLEEIKKLEVFNYVYKKDSTKTPHVGVIAQDLMKIFPNAVFKGDDGFYRIRMEDMFYALVNAVKELDKKIDLLAEKQKEIDSLRAEVKSLKKDYADLEKRIEKLEKRK